MENQPQTTTIRPGSILTTEKSTYVIQKLFPSTSDIQLFSCSIENHHYLLKVYQNSSHLNLLQREKNFVNFLIFESEAAELSLKIVDQNTKNPPFFLIYDLDDFICISSFLQTLDPQSYFKLIQNLLQILARLFSLKLIHSNLNLETIFVNNKLQLKVIGFENCIRVNELANEDLKGYFFIQEKAFKAPELMGSGYSIGRMIDVWSLGCVILKILLRSQTSEENDWVSVSLKKMNESALEANFEKCVSLMLNVDPLLRPTPKNLQLALNRERIALKYRFSGKYTCDLFKIILKDKSSRISFSLVEELILRIKRKAGRVEKLGESLNAFNYRRISEVLKAFYILQMSCFYMRHNMIDNLVVNFCKSNFDRVTERDNFEIVDNYKILIERKINLCKNLKFNSDLTTTEETFISFKEILRYKKSLLELVENILYRSNLHDISEEIIKMCIKEILILCNYLLISEDLENSAELKNFLIFRKNFSKTIQTVYRIYGFITFDFGSLSSIQKHFTYLTIESIKYINKFKIIEENLIGRGATSFVKKASYKKTPVALKIFISVEECRNNDYFKREVGLLNSLNHENIAGFIGIYTDKINILKFESGRNSKQKHKIAVLEYCEGGSLDDLIYNKSISITLNQKIKIMRDIVKGMVYLHSQTIPIIHRDLKPNNILILKKISSTVDIPIAKITDFGHSKHFQDTKMSSRIGSHRYMAPEVIESQPYDTKCDVFSFGIVLWELFSGRSPYSEINNFNEYSVSKKNQRPDLAALGSDVPAFIKNLIINAWDSDPKKRPSFQEIQNILDSIENHSINPNSIPDD